MLSLSSPPVMPNSLQPHGPQHARPLCPSPSPEVFSSSCPLHQWCYPAISSSDAFFSFCLQSFLASGTYPMSQLFASDCQNTEVSASASVLQMNIQGWFPLRLIGLSSLMSKELSRVFSSTTIQALWQAISKMAYTKGHLPGLLLPVACPWGEPLLIHTSAGASCAESSLGASLVVQ